MIFTVIPFFLNQYEKLSEWVAWKNFVIAKSFEYIFIVILFHFWRVEWVVNFTKAEESWRLPAAKYAARSECKGRNCPRNLYFPRLCFFLFHMRVWLILFPGRFYAIEVNCSFPTTNIKEGWYGAIFLSSGIEKYRVQFLSLPFES